MSAASRLPAGARSLELPEPLPLAVGGALAPVRVAYQTWGELAPSGDNAVLVCHALTGSSHAAGTPADPGWWDGVIGPGRALDPTRHFIVCPNLLGSCYGTTGPGDPDPATGRPWGMRFPLVTPHDMVEVQHALLKHLGVRRLALVVGGSLGGMLVWQWLVDHPEMVSAAAPVAAAPRASAWSIALNAVARGAILSDPAWQGGDYDGEGPTGGLALARQIAMISYRSETELAARFGRAASVGGPDAVPPRHALFAVESYLRHHGDKLVRRFDARSYVVLTEAMDRHDVACGRGGLDAALARVEARVLGIGISSDVLFFPHEVRDAVRQLESHGKQARYAEIESIHGHDAFLIEQDVVGSLLATLLAGG